jgi:hypothetical protein
MPIFFQSSADSEKGGEPCTAGRSQYGKHVRPPDGTPERQMLEPGDQMATPEAMTY